MIPDWSQLTPAEFEQVCYRLLEAAGFKNLRWYGKAGGDKGRDIVGEKTEHPLPGTERLSHWVVQCKRYLKGQTSKSGSRRWTATTPSISTRGKKWISNANSRGTGRKSVSIFRGSTERVRQ